MLDVNFCIVLAYSVPNLLVIHFRIFCILHFVGFIVFGLRIQELNLQLLTKQFRLSEARFQSCNFGMCNFLKICWDTFHEKLNQAKCLNLREISYTITCCSNLLPVLYIHHFPQISAIIPLWRVEET